MHRNKRKMPLEFQHIKPHQVRGRMFLCLVKCHLQTCILRCKYSATLHAHIPPPVLWALIQGRETLRHPSWVTAGGDVCIPSRSELHLLRDSPFREEVCVTFFLHSKWKQLWAPWKMYSRFLLFTIIMFMHLLWTLNWWTLNHCLGKYRVRFSGAFWLRWHTVVEAPSVMAAFYPLCKIIRTLSLFLQNSAFISNVAPVMGSALFCWRQLGRCWFFPNSTLRLGSNYYCLVDPSVMREMLCHSVLPITAATSHTGLLSAWNGIGVSKELNSKLYFILIHLQLYVASKLLCWTPPI